MSASGLAKSGEYRLALLSVRVEGILTGQANRIDSHIIPESHLYRLFDGGAARGIVAIRYQDDNTAGFFCPSQLVTRGFIEGIKYGCPACRRKRRRRARQVVGIVREVLQ